MSAPLEPIDGHDAGVVFAALREALTSDGPAVFPVADASVPAAGFPTTVPRAVALVVQTSGSTAAPKRVMLTADAVLASASASAAAVGGSGQWLLALPAHYIAGANVLIRSIAAGTTPVVLGAGHFDARAFAAAASTLTAEKRFTSLVPAQLARVVEAGEKDPTVRDAAARFDRILVGGQASDPALIDRAAALGIRATRTYGSSETGGGCVYDGSPIGDTGVAIIDGEVHLSGSVLALGYLGDAARTAAAFVTHDDRRWYRTGDNGERSPDGRLRITGRADNVIISGGEKVSLDALERFVRSLQGFADAVVVGAPSAQWGQVPVVAVPAGHAPDLAELRALVGDAFGAAARPARIIELPAMPLLPSGKPDRRAIAARAIADAG